MHWAFISGIMTVLCNFQNGLAVVLGSCR